MSIKNNPLTVYDRALKDLDDTRYEPELKHQAVLALARAGSLEFALAEYRRYGLDTIRDHEEIMALGGRLYKDLFLASSDEEAREYAMLSSEKYELAYRDTGGCYSGINAGTMALLADVSLETVHGRAKDILRELPNIEDLSKEELYFIEATRAEAYLLLGDINQAKISWRNGIDHDPLNYIAHASTLKQFRMICQFRAEPCDWLTPFAPPKSAHYSGHMFLTVGATRHGMVMSESDENALRIEISDAIQRHDIGFGFGALAAGSDILIAETLLEEGCESHVVLPVGIDLFLEHSVTPFGADWGERFQKCIDKASSVDIAIPSALWPSSKIDEFSRALAMGRTIMQAETLSVDAVQLLLWDGVEDESWTAKVADEWTAYERAQHVIPYTKPRKTSRRDEVDLEAHRIQCVLCCDDESEPLMFETLNYAVVKALELQSASETPIRLGIHMGIAQNTDKITKTAQTLSNHAVPKGILVSETVASHLALHYNDMFTTDYMGRVDDTDTGVRAFSLKTKGGHFSAI